MARAAGLAVAMVLLTGCTGYRLIRDGAVQPNAADKIKAKLVAIRGLGFQRPVPVIAVSATEARGMLEEEIKHNGWLTVPFSRHLLFGAPIETRYEAALAQLGITRASLSSVAGNA